MFSFKRRLPAAPAAPLGRPVRPETPPPAELHCPGCGWFDSSHELRHGLRVNEELPPDAVARLVPLSWWLAWELDAALPPVR
ncbi:MAG: hypothetical protein IV093_13475 [Rubrivivax sp.]|nr:hypothetical protein [Rubrivivax sp.]